MTSIERDTVNSVTAFYVMSDDPYEKLVACIARSMLKDPEYDELVTLGSVEHFFDAVRSKVSRGTGSAVAMLQMCVKYDVAKDQR